MTEASDLISSYKGIRERLRHPPNAVFDRGINLHCKRLPTEPSPKKVLECGIATSCRVSVTETLPVVCSQNIKLADIERVVCFLFQIRPQVLYGRQRCRRVVYPRQICWYLAYKHTGRSMPEIGRRAGGYDHTTILHAARKISEMLLVDPKTQKTVSELEAMLFPQNDPKADLPQPSMAAEPKLDLAQEQTISLPKLEIYGLD